MRIHRASCKYGYGITDQYYELEEIVGVFGSKESRWYKVKWAGYLESEWQRERTYYYETDVKMKSETSGYDQACRQTGISTRSQTGGTGVQSEVMHTSESKTSKHTKRERSSGTRTNQPQEKQQFMM